MQTHYIKAQSDCRRPAKIASGDLAGGVPVNGSDEIASLAAAFNAMTANVKEKNAAIIASEARLRSLINNMPDCMWTADETGRVTSISPMVLNICGYTVHEFLSGLCPMFDNIHPDDIQTVRSHTMPLSAIIAYSVWSTGSKKGRQLGLAP